MDYVKIQTINLQSNIHVSKYKSMGTGLRYFEYQRTYNHLLEHSLRITQIPETYAHFTRAAGDKIVFTNGCFDILHVGHIRLFKYAFEKYRSGIVVGINSDESVKRLKGPTRPINKLADRIEILYTIQYIDKIFKFDEDTPEKLIVELRPDVLIKGGDYKDKKIIGEDFVRSYGGIIDKEFFVPGYSTTAIEGALHEGTTKSSDTI